MDINDHPVWKAVPKYKKPFHLLRLNLAKQYTKLYPTSTFIGITGSVGKTTCTNACFEVLSQKYSTLATKTSLDPVFNLPITLLKVSPKVKKVILEMGIEYQGEMDFYLSLVRPKIAIVTKIANQHNEFLGSLNDIITEKGKLVEQLPADGFAILNWDDINTRKLAEKTKAQVVFYGTDPKHCNVWAGNIRIENLKTTFELNYGVERIQVTYPLLGEHQIYPALAAAALGIVEGISLGRIKKGLENVAPAEHRLQSLTGPHDSIILDDTYNAAPTAVEAAIMTLLRIPSRRKIVVLGEMRELGEYTEQMHQEIARLIYKEKIDIVILGQGDTRYIAEELESLGYWEDKLFANLQNSQIVALLLKTLVKGDVCLIKGARAVRLDEVVKRITKKGLT